MAMFYAEIHYQELAVIGEKEVDVRTMTPHRIGQIDSDAWRVRWTARWIEKSSSDVVKEMSDTSKNLALARKAAQKWKNKNNPERKRGVFSWL